MKYIMIFDEDEFKDLRYQFNQYTSTAKVNGDVKQVIPCIVPLLISETGLTAPLSEGPIDCLRQYDKEQMFKEMINRMMEDKIEEDYTPSIDEMRRQFGLPTLDHNAVVKLDNKSDS